MIKFKRDVLYKYYDKIIDNIHSSTTTGQLSVCLAMYHNHYRKVKGTSDFNSANDTIIKNMIENKREELWLMRIEF